MKQAVLFQQYQVTHITDKSGFPHRVCWGGHNSEWTGYNFIAILAVNGRLFCGTTPYYDGVLPELFEVLI